MHALKQKLSSQRGASMLMALLLFLVCTMVGAVIVTSATAAVDHTRTMEQTQQQYLTISSAARLLQQSLGGLSGSAWEQVTVYDCAASREDFIKDQDTKEVALQMEGDHDGKLQSQLLALAYRMYRSQTAHVPNQTPPTMPVRFEVRATDMEPVQVTMTMEPTYDLVLQLTMEEGDHTMTVIFPATKQTPAPELVTGSCTHEYEKTQWNDELGEFETKTYDVNFDVTTYTYRTNITWGSGTISKGVLGGA